MKTKLSYNQFEILRLIERNNKKLSQRELSKFTGLSLGTVNKIVMSLSNDCFIDENNLITKKGVEVLEPYRVKKAIILAAGFGSRMMPITLNTPKPLVRVNGVRIIESLLEAVTESEIEEVIIVTGYLKEQFRELQNKYKNIKFIDNDVYNETNNISSAYYAKDYFGSSYILEADLLLYNKNLIQKYEYSSNYLCKYVKKTDDWCLDLKKGFLTNFRQGGSDCYHIYGISFYTEEDGKKLSKSIENLYLNVPGGKEQFYDYAALVYDKDNFNMSLKECKEGDIVEIDSFNELKEIDSSYNI